MTARLHCFGESGNAYKCALAMALAGYPWEPVFVDFFNGATRTPEFRRLNGMGEVPVLEDGGQVLTQSGLILRHIAERSGKFLPADLESEVWRWILWDNHKFSTQIGTLRFQMNFVPEAKRQPEVIAFFQARLNSAYRVLDAHLASRGWAAGREVTIADLSLCGYLYYPEPFGFTRADWPAIDRWLARIAALPGWRHPYDLMPGRPSDRA
ncbi:MAG: glutathione S-transferase family protein [Paracoccaceae bacterium]